MLPPRKYSKLELTKVALVVFIIFITKIHIFQIKQIESQIKDMSCTTWRALWWTFQTWVGLTTFSTGLSGNIHKWCTALSIHYVQYSSILGLRKAIHIWFWQRVCMCSVGDVCVCMHAVVVGTWRWMWSKNLPGRVFVIWVRWTRAGSAVVGHVPFWVSVNGSEHRGFEIWGCLGRGNLLHTTRQDPLCNTTCSKKVNMQSNMHGPASVSHLDQILASQIAALMRWL